MAAFPRVSPGVGRLELVSPCRHCAERSQWMLIKKEKGGIGSLSLSSSPSQLFQDLPLRYSLQGLQSRGSMQRTVSAILKHNLNLVPCYLNKSSASHLHPCLQEPSTLKKETNASGLPLSPSQGRETEAKVSKKKKKVTLASQSEYPIHLDMVIGSEGST